MTPERLLSWHAALFPTGYSGLTHTGTGSLREDASPQRFYSLSAQIQHERQIKLLNRLLDGFDGKLTSSKWAAIGKCSGDTALRDINELVVLGVLEKSASGGRSTSYEIRAK